MKGRMGMIESDYDEWLAKTQPPSRKAKAPSRPPAKRAAPELDVNYRTRSVALIRGPDTRPRFQVICYGMSHSELCTVTMDDVEGQNMSGGARLFRRLEARGIDTRIFTGNVFETGEIHEAWRDDKGGAHAHGK